MRKFLVIPLVLVVYVLLGGPTASAHSGKQSYVYLSFYDAGIDGRVELPAADLGPVIGIEFGDDGAEIAAVAAANEDAIVAYLDDHMSLRSIDGDEWTLGYGEIDVLDLGPRSYLLVSFEVTEDLDPTPREIVVEFDAIIEANPEKDALLHIENDVRSGVLQNESDPLLGFSTGMTVQTVALETVSTPTQIGAVRGVGTEAVRNGVVHIMFVIAVLAPVALLVRGRGFDGPAPTIATVARRSAVVLGVYAAGHLTTLWVVGLGVVDVSSSVAVALSAASLLAAAIWAIGCWLRPAVARHEAAVVAALGVLQGFGFARDFVDDGFDRSRTIVSLIGYSIGIEVGVVIVAALALVPMTLVRRTPLAPVVLVAVAAVAAAYASAWILEGVTGAEWELDRVENPWRVWPRGLVVGLLVAAAAAGVRAIFASRGDLRPLDDDTDPVDDDVADPRSAVPA